jgi:hypothetical protein
VTRPAIKISLFKLGLLASLTVAGAAIARADPPPYELSLNVTVVTSEHGRDSHATATHLSIAGDMLTFEENYYGAHANRQPPVKKAYKLTSDDRDKLIGLLKANGLLTTRTIANPTEPDGPSRDFKLTITTTLDGRESVISISAPLNATKLKSDPLYQGSIALIAELYRIINRTDRHTFSDLIG